MQTGCIRIANTQGLIQMPDSMSVWYAKC